SATALYGLFSGPVSTLVNLPVALSLAIGVAVVPHLSKNKEERDLKAIRLKTTTAIKTAVLIGVPFAVLYLIAPHQILKFLYGGLSEGELFEATKLLRISAPTVVLLAVMQICTSVLQGLKNTRSPIINLLIGGAVKTASGLFLLFNVGIEGVAIASLIAFTVVCLLNALSLSKLMGKNGDVVKNSGVIILLGGIIAIGLTVAVYLTESPIWILLTAVIGGIIYLIAVFLSHAFGKEELISLPFGRALVKLKK
ncbi:MAG: polysaccharide biosynthesis C-terminal domain-containing protein, partial [Clostridia bacterium]|nr:polysaccharide biosynthesis C-terminal domain-containing protein [Clostridia bacterium]